MNASGLRLPSSSDTRTIATRVAFALFLCMAFSACRSAWQEAPRPWTSGAHWAPVEVGTADSPHIWFSQAEIQERGAKLVLVGKSLADSPDTTELPLESVTRILTCEPSSGVDQRSGFERGVAFVVEFALVMTLAVAPFLVL